MATELGQAYVQIMPSAKGISGSIQKQFDPEAETAGKSAGSKLGAGLKVAAVAAIAATGIALGKIISSSLAEGANLQQSLGGIETLFKENADKVKQYANEAYKTAGLSANAYMENVTSFSASLLQSLGGDTEKAADKANTAMIDMADNSNKMGTSMESIQNAYSGFAKSNYTMLDNLSLGYGGTKEEMNRLLADATKLSGVKYDINNLADVYDAIHVVQTELGITGTTAEEAAKTLSGSLAAMKGAFANFLGKMALGEDIVPSLEALAETVSTYLFGNFFPMVGNILKALPGAFVTFIQSAAPYFQDAAAGIITNLTEGLSTGFPELLERGKELVTNIANGILTALPTMIESAGNIISTFVGFLMEKLPEVLSTGKDLLLNLVNGIIQNLPAIVASAIKAVSNFIDIVIANLPGVVVAGVKLLAELVSGIISNLPALIAAAVVLIARFIGMIVSKMPDLLVLGGKMLLSLVSGIGQLASNLYGMAAELMSGLMAKIGEWTSKFKDAGANIVGAIADGIKGSIGKATGAMGNVTKAIRDFLPFSPAKTGALKDLARLNFGGTIAESIYAAENPVTSAMGNLAKKTMNSYDVNKAISMTGRMSPNTSDARLGEGIVNGLAGIMPQHNSQPIIIQNILDGKMISQTIWDPLQSLAKQKGVAFSG